MGEVGSERRSLPIVCDAGLLSADICTVSHLTRDEAERCSTLTLGLGEMRNSLQSTLRALQTDPCHRVGRDPVILLYEHGHIVAWALLPSGSRGPGEVWMYVAAAYRRRGLGRIVFGVVRERWPDVKVCPWDRQSAAFYQSFKRAPAVSDRFRPWLPSL
jgi:GNAT superfamily N-acetyltransferase